MSIDDNEKILFNNNKGDMSFDSFISAWRSSGKLMKDIGVGEMMPHFVDACFCEGGLFQWGNTTDKEEMELKFCRNYPGKKPAYWDGWTKGYPPLTYENIVWVPNKTGLELPSFVWKGKEWRLLRSLLNIEFYNQFATLLVYDD